MTDQYGYTTEIENDRCRAEIHVDFHNSRVRLLDYDGDTDSIIGQLTLLCADNDLGKIICTVRREDRNGFLQRGFLAEGKIDGYFHGKTADAVSYFHKRERMESGYIKEENEILRRCEGLKGTYAPNRGSPFQPRAALPSDAEELAGLFARVFQSYPTPAFDPSYIEKAMGDHTRFMVIESEGKIVSAASADMNGKMKNAEITDCATLEEFRGKGLLSELICFLEQDLKQKVFITAFSLARARSFGMNAVLSKHGYEYTGRLVNNCDIMGGFEDMNIWCKRLDR